MVGIGEQRAVGEAGGESAAEAALIRAARAGDRVALEELLGPHQRALVAFCYGILGSVEDAEDAAQETFLRALRALATFRGEAAFRSWLFRIALNLCATWKRSRRPTEPWHEEGRFPGSGAASPEAVALDRLQIMHALRSLPRRHRALLLLKEWEGWSMAEIAAALGWSETRVKNELYKARRALAEWRRQEADEGENR
jgi:RNA polymerase sigma-70 factor (ECF subfamily)